MLTAAVVEGRYDPAGLIRFAYRLRPAARGADCRKRSGGEKVAAFVQAARADEIEPAAIGLFVRSHNELARARAAAAKAGIEAIELAVARARPDGSLLAPCTSPRAWSTAP